MKNDVFLSHNRKDKPWVRAFAEFLRLQGLSVFFDEDSIAYGEDLVAAIETGVEQSRHILLVISPSSVSSKWVAMEASLAVYSDPDAGNRKVIPILLEPIDRDAIKPSIRRLNMVDLTNHERREKAVRKLLEELGIRNSSILPLPTGLFEKEDSIIGPPKSLLADSETLAFTREEQILNSLRKRLDNDFFISGPRRGEFGKTRIPDESRHYHDFVRESLKHKPHYYLTYWGWQAMPKLLPHLVGERTGLTVETLKQRFAGKRWIEVDLEDYDSGPTVPFRRVETVRHTAKAAEILLLIHESTIPSQVAWDFINKSPFLMTAEGGWKEFNIKEASSSLWASIYVFRLLSLFRDRMRDSEMPGEFDHFMEKSAALIQRTERYLESHWRQFKWKFSSLPYQVNAPSLLIEYVPFAKNDAFVEDVYKTLRNLVSPAGCLIDPNVGTHYGASEYVLSIRLAYALKLTNSLKKRNDTRAEKLADWVLEDYADEHTLDTCDIAFLNEIIGLTIT